MFLIRRRQVARQPGAVTAEYLFITLAWFCRHCTALRVAMQGCHASCSSSSFVTAAIVSFAALHSTAPLFRSITPRSQPNILLQGMAHLAKHKHIHTNGLMPFASQQHGSPGSIPLRSSLFHFSPAQSTRCPLFGSPAIPTSAAFAKCCAVAQTLTHGSFVPHFAMQH